MELKKSDKANLEKKRFLMIEIGLVVALGIVFLAFELKSAPSNEKSAYQQEKAIIEEDDVQVTRQDEPPPPPPEPPKVADMLTIVSNEVEINNDIQFNAEVDENTEIEAAEFTGVEVKEEAEDEEFLFAVLEDKPTFNGKPAEEGFREYVSQNTHYPPVAQENGIQGKVYVEFTIDKTGAVTNVKILRGVDATLDAEALRVIKASPKWTPGKQRGKPVKVKYQFPVNFKLS